VKIKAVHLVRCCAGGYALGSCMENAFGEPLTRREALKMARFENEHSERRRAQGLGCCFTYYAHQFTPEGVSI
jgi:hypothetical protein